MKVSAVNMNLYNPSFSGVRKIIQKKVANDIGDFLVRPVRELTLKDGIDYVTRFYTQKGKEVGYHAVGNNGNMIGQRLFSNGTKLQYWTDLSESNKKILAVWIEARKAATKPAERVTGRLAADTISKNPKLISTKSGLLDLIKQENNRIFSSAKKLFKNSERKGLFEDVTNEVL